MERTGETRTNVPPHAGANARRTGYPTTPNPARTTDTPTSLHDVTADAAETTGRPWGVVRHEVERAIRSVPGVLEASVGVSEETGRGRLRIRLAPGEDHDAVCWAVAATLRERFGIALDPAAIRPRGEDVPEPVPPPEPTPLHEPRTAPAAPSAPPWATAATSASAAASAAASGSAAAHEEPTLRPFPPTGTPARAARTTSVPGPVSGPPVGDAAGGERVRAAIGDLVTEHGAAAVSVTATLSHGGREGRGAVGALATRRATWRAVAEATLHALQDLTGGRLRAQVERVTVNTAEDPGTVSVVLAVLSERGEETLLGAALVREDAERAVMRATLDALNRRVEPWLRDLAHG
ncbi:hypothetical protein [Egicoccus sp. AB-alg2]|uniref:hypothetical protein n=1 Tax=Egicoccus sp. AB-alg2 TaxID=3242693 RepID=UPI00359E1A60